jgi:hypothetical protein
MMTPTVLSNRPASEHADAERIVLDAAEDVASDREWRALGGYLRAGGQR